MTAILVSAAATALLLALLVVVLWQLPAKACCYHRHAVEAPPWKRGIHWREWHHGYALVGFPVCVWGVLQLPGWWKLLPIVVGLFLLWCYVDDLRQHLTQLRDPTKRY